MADIVMLPTAAAQPVINPKRRGYCARGGKVTLACDLVARRWRKEKARREHAAEAGAWESLAKSLASDVRAAISDPGRQRERALQPEGGSHGR